MRLYQLTVPLSSIEFSAFRVIVLGYHSFLTSKPGYSSLFQYFLDDWSAQGILRVEFSCLFALTQNPQATVRDSWDALLKGALLDQQVEDILNMQNA